MACRGRNTWQEHHLVKNDYLCLNMEFLKIKYCINPTIRVISGSQSPRHGTSSSCGWRNGLQYGWYLRIYWISSRGRPTRGGPPACGLGEVLTTPHHENVPCYEIFTKPRTWTLYGCETWSLTLREERRLRVSENRVLRRIFGSKKDEVTGEWRKLHNEELNDLYFSPNIMRVIKSRIMSLAGHVVCMGEGRGVYSVLVGIPEGRRPLERRRHRWGDNIKMNLQEVRSGVLG